MTLYEVPSISNAPAIQRNDWVVVSTYPSLKRHSFIVFNAPQGGAPFVKRLIGLPNETISVKDQHVYINGLLLDEPYVPDPSHKRPEAKDLEVQLQPDQLFVLGDNRASSMDSRAFGPINSNTVIGTVIHIIRADGSP